MLRVIDAISSSSTSPLAGPSLAGPTAGLTRLGLMSGAELPQVAQNLLRRLLLQELAWLMSGLAGVGRAPDQSLGQGSGPAPSQDQSAGQAGDRGSTRAESVGQSPSSSNQAAQEIAREMAGYKYEFYYNERKSVARTEGSRAGNCKDLADVAIEKFRQRGVQARLVLGDVRSKSYTGGHYWVEYQEADGQWRFFDPTGAATNKSAQRAFQGLHATYRKR